jgi:hypothetical protein
MEKAFAGGAFHLIAERSINSDFTALRLTLARCFPLAGLRISNSQHCMVSGLAPGRAHSLSPGARFARARNACS